MMRKALMISHGFPPVGGSGMLRTLKFSRYLPDSGWQPVILTLRKTKHPRLDPKLQAEVPPQTPIYRAPTINPINFIVRLRGLVARLFSRGAGTETETAAASGAEIKMPMEHEGGFGGFVKDLLTTPDGYSGWYLPGLFQGLWAFVAQRPRLIYSTSPPPTAHLIGLSLAGLTRLPWVVDFRDPWTLQHEGKLNHGRRGRWNRKLEASVIRRASRVICNTEPMAAAFRDAYPQVAAEKFVVVTNGFDPADFGEDPSPPAGSGPYLFLHAGEFVPQWRLRVPDQFLEALRDLYEEGALEPGSVKARFIGSGEYSEMESFKRLIASPALAKAVEVIDFLPHEEIPRQLAESDALLLFQNGEIFRMQIPAKVFEYIRSGRPVLAVASAGATADLVKGLDGGRAVHPEDPETMRRTILAMVRARGEFHARGPEELERYSRPGLTRKLASLFDEVVKRG